MISRRLASFVSAAVLFAAVPGFSRVQAQHAGGQEPRVVRANIAALDQLLVYNRFGSYNPFGMIFALGRDVESRATEVKAFTAASCAGQLGTEGPDWAFHASEVTGTRKAIGTIAGNARLRDCKRPRPLVIRGNVGDVLEIRLANLLLDRDHPGPYRNTQAGNSVGEKPGYTDTFCSRRPENTKTSAKASRYGLDLKGLANEEDALRDASEVGCNLKSYDEGKKNWIAEHPEAWNSPPPAGPADPHLAAKPNDTDWPSTRHVSLVINGLTNLPDAGGKIDPACRGLGAVSPGAIVTCRWALDRDGTHFISSQAAVAGGEGDGGSLTHGLFGALIIEPQGSKAYRSQVTKAALDEVWKPAPSKGQHARESFNIANYDKLDLRPEGAGRPVLNMHRKTGEATPVAEEVARRPVYELIHGDLNAIIDEPTPNGRQSFREFTAILHDELKTFYTDHYLELSLFGHGQLAGARDGFAINYGASGMGTMLIANRKRIGPAADCVDCLYEESFLQSWVNGDPALLEHYPDDPSNVHHSYLNDRVVFRNFHAGPKETHIFHLHAHQWFAGNDRNRGSYLDSQTVGPQQGFSYRIYGGGQGDYGLPKTAAGLKDALGAGNANRTPGDSIFHCHLYPHFAQGMWALWRNHDVLEDGTRLLPDGQDHAGLSTDVREAAKAGKRLTSRGGTFLKSGRNLLGQQPFKPTDDDFLAESPRREEIIVGGTPIPAIVPLPGAEPPPLPTYGEEGMPGYPFYIPGQAGRRAPQAPMDIARKLDKSIKDRPVVIDEALDGGLPRHLVESGVRAFEAAEGHASENKFADKAAIAASASATLARSLALANFGAHLKSAQVKLLPYDGTALERRAMAFHHNGLLPDGKPLAMKDAKGDLVHYDPGTGSYGGFAVNGGAPRPGAPFADPCALPDAVKSVSAKRWPNGLYASGGRTISPIIDRLNVRAAGASPSPELTPDPGLIGFRRYEVSAIQLRLVVNRAGWHDPQSRVNMLSEASGQYEGSDHYKGSTRGDVEPFFFRAHSGECIEFRHTNELPKDLARDDFQVKTPTDTIGQHIHLVKFDVMAADGSANGWNYEDGTFAPDEVHHRICAAIKGGADANAAGSYQAPALRLFGRACKVGDLSPDERDREYRAGKVKDDIPDLKIYKKKRTEKPEWFQTTVQRWFADPLLTPTGLDEVAQQHPELRDRTLRTVFTHDHFGPSSIQQHGFYSALVIEPPQTMICPPERKSLGNGGADYLAACTNETDKAYVAGAAHYYVSGGPQHVGARKLVLANAEKVVQVKRDATTVLNREIAAKGAVIAANELVLKDPGATPEQKAEAQIAIAAAQEAKAKAEDNLLMINVGTHPSLNALNMREYALAIADFALLYDPYGKRPADSFYTTQGSTTQGNGRENAKGLDCLIIEARLKAANAGSEAFSRGCDPRHIGGIAAHVRTGNLPPAYLAALDSQTAETLAQQTFLQIRQEFGYPVSPPQRPEAISVDHHDPYLVNYRNEPIPLRVGESRSPSDNYPRRSCAELAQSPKLVAPSQTASRASVDRQKAGEPGDMANVFRSTHAPAPTGDTQVLHSDPCTPIIEAYEGERVQIRLIQGAQEVQHAFTLEGYTFPRNIDQRMPAQSTLPAHYSNWLDGARTRQRECHDQSRNASFAGHLSQLYGDDLPRLVFLRAQCDNLDGRIAAQEIGISEHFEFSGRFNADGQSAERTGTKSRKEEHRSASSRETALRLIMASNGGDTLYHFGTQDALWNGAWGLVRVARPTGRPAEKVPEYIDHSKCLSRIAGGETKTYACLKDLFNRLPMLQDLFREVLKEAFKKDTEAKAMAGLQAEPIVPLEARKAAKPANARDILPVVDAVVDCPVENATDLVNIAAIRQAVVEYSGKLRDQHVLRLVPDKGGNQSLEELRKTPEQPLVIHMTAGRCLKLQVRNLLDTTPHPHYGNARMPGITSLNVDYGDWNKETGGYDDGDPSKDALRLTHSSRLALSIPLTTTSPRSEIPAPFGINYTGAAGAQETQILTFYAGTMHASWERFEAALNLGQMLPPACADFTLSGLHPGFAEKGEKNVTVLGKRYALKAEWRNPNTKPANDLEINGKLRSCLLAVVIATKSPEPYAFGALPIKSFGDVIGHTAHGLIGTLVVNPATARITLDKTGDFGPHCEVGADTTSPKAFIGATTQITNRSCLPAQIQLPDKTIAEFTMLPRTVISAHTLFWQDGLNLRDQHMRAVSDCLTCDDSYDFGKRAVSYRTGMLAERMEKTGTSGRPQVHGAFDLNAVSIPKDIYVPGTGSKTLHLPPLFSRAGDEVTFRLIHPGGRARQRAFVMTGAGYEDLFPGFGFPSSALLAPGKAISASLLRPARTQECNFWRDGPAYMVGQGVWGLHAVGGANDNAEDICKAAAR